MPCVATSPDNRSELRERHGSLDGATHQAGRARECEPADARHALGQAVIEHRCVSWPFWALPVGHPTAGRRSPQPYYFMVSKILSLPVFFTTRQRAGLREGYFGRHQTARPVLHLHDSLEAHLRSVRRLAGAPNMRLKWPRLGAKLPVITAPMKVGFPNDRARELTFGKPLKAEVWLG